MPTTSTTSRPARRRRRRALTRPAAPEPRFTPETIEQLRELIESVVRGPARENPTWERMIAEYTLMLEPACQDYRRDIAATLERFRAGASVTTAAELTGPLIAAFLNGRAATGISPFTVAKDRRNLKAFFNWAVRAEYLRRNPILELPRLRLPTRTPISPQDAEWVRLLAVIPRVALDDPQAWHLLILLAIVTGLRERALLGIRVADLNLPADGAGLLRAVSKGNVESYHGVPPVVCERIRMRLHQLPAGAEYLFPWRHFHVKAWHRVAAAAHFGFTFQALRRASGTRRAESAGAASARDGLGHTDERVTRGHYLAITRVQLAIAGALTLPPLPPFPRYRAYLIRPNAKPRPQPVQKEQTRC
jgi:integrase